MCLLIVGGLAPLQPGDFGWVDSGAFLYIARQILQGDLPYRDAWDHKPPLIFYLNALGLWLGQGTPWGIWVIALASLALAIGLCYRLAAGVYGRGPALVAVTCFCAALIRVLDHYNLTEFFALPLQFALLHLFLRGAPPLWLGSLTGALFLLRQNLAGAGITAALGLLWRERPPRRLLASWLGMLAGFGIVVALASAYLYAAGCGREAWEAFLYNFTYIQVSWSERWDALLFGARLLRRLVVLAAVGLLPAVFLWRRYDPGVRMLVTVSALNLVLEAALSALSGRLYSHYFMTWTPALGLLAGHGAFALVALAGRLPGGWASPRGLRTGAALCVAATLWLNVPLWQYARRRVSRLTRPVRRASDAPAAYIRSHTRPGETIFVWGYAPDLYLLGGRAAPTRFFFQRRLLDRPDPPDRATIETLVADLARGRPSLVLDSSLAPAAYLPIDVTGRRPPPDPAYGPLCAALEPLFRLVRENYEPVEAPELGYWRVYRRK